MHRKINPATYPAMFDPPRLIQAVVHKPLIAAPLLGALAALGFEPLHLWPLMLLAVAGLAELIARAPNAKRAVLIGWLWGAGHFCIGNNWIATAFTYQAEMPAWLGWLGVLLVALYLAVYPALAALGAWQFRARSAAFALAFGGFWIISEWLRGWVFTGYAWNPLGVALIGPFDGQGLAMLARWVGTYGLSGIAALLALLLRYAVISAPTDRRRAVGAGALLIVLLVPMVVTGTIAAPEGRLSFTLVQPNIAQEDIENPAKFNAQFVKTAQLSLPRKPGERRLVLWPESGVPDYLRDGYPLYFYQDTTFAEDPKRARERIAHVVGKNSAVLTGSVDLDVRREQVISAQNVVTVLDDSGAIRASYAKAHLVPYGEYLPMRPLLEPLGLSRLVAGSVDFRPGPGAQTLNLGPWGRAGIQVCYEIVFSGEVVDRAHRPDYIFNPTNDGWFGDWGPPQHLAQARMRAIEEGLPVLRATTSGISAVIDADGIVRQSLPRFVAGRLDGKVPPAHVPTLFARGGNMLALGLAAVLLGLSLLVLRRARR